MHTGVYKLTALARAVRVALGLALLVLAGCKSAGATQPDVPVSTVIEVPVKVYVPIEANLTKRCPWPLGAKPSQAVEVAKKRRECLEAYERQLDAIGKVQGQPVP